MVDCQLQIGCQHYLEASGSCSAHCKRGLIIPSLQKSNINESGINSKSVMEENKCIAIIFSYHSLIFLTLVQSLQPM